MQIFARANEALQADLSAYAHALRTIVAELPRARALCERVVKETRLVQALLAFGGGPHAGELAQLALQLSNLWPFRDDGAARTTGFGNEIAEAQALHTRALHGVQLSRGSSSDPLAAELVTCFSNIAEYLEDQLRILERCHATIHPYAANLEVTRKRLTLMVAAIDARMPAGAEQQRIMHTYAEAAELLQRWEGGVPLDQHGIEILDHCLEILERSEGSAIALQQAPTALRG